MKIQLPESIDSRLADSETIASWQKVEFAELSEEIKNRTYSLFNIPEEYVGKLRESEGLINDWYEWQIEKIAVQTERAKTLLSREVWNDIDIALARILWVPKEKQTMILINDQLIEFGLKPINPVNYNNLEKVA